MEKDIDKDAIEEGQDIPDAGIEGKSLEELFSYENSEGSDIYQDDSWNLLEDTGKVKIEVLTFILEEEEYGIDVLELKEVVRPVGITYVPRAPKFIDGIVSIRGMVIPMLDLKQILSLDNNTISTNNRFIFIKSSRGIIGFTADTVREVVRMDEDTIEAPPSMKGTRTDMLRGVGRYDDRMIILLNFNSILDVIWFQERDGRHYE